MSTNSYNLKNTTTEFKDKVEVFVWDFKIGDNIKYNYNVLEELIKANAAGSLLNKPIAVISVSIIEAIMVDFISRLREATNHFPEGIDENDRETIKERLSKETREEVGVDVFGDEYTYKRLRNFGFSELIEIFDEFKFLGHEAKIYEFMKALSYFRNRIHIKNYFNNFEKDEVKTFSNERTAKTINMMEWVIDYFEEHYYRPWGGENKDTESSS